MSLGLVEDRPVTIAAAASTPKRKGLASSPRRNGIKI